MMERIFFVAFLMRSHVTAPRVMARGKMDGQNLTSIGKVYMRHEMPNGVLGPQQEGLDPNPNRDLNVTYISR